ncbi:hypothetical protein PTKIN_Ptkin14bG0201500 [Pterospermum kingtungense]
MTSLHLVELCYLEAPKADYLNAAIETVLKTHVSESPGAILVFFTNKEEIETAGKFFKDRIRGFGIKMAELFICPIYANHPTKLQAKLFERTPEGTSKVVLATYIAEASLTIDGIKYVIDTGFCKMKSYNPSTGLESLLVTPISKVGMHRENYKFCNFSPKTSYPVLQNICCQDYLACTFRSGLKYFVLNR